MGKLAIQCRNRVVNQLENSSFGEKMKEIILQCSKPKREWEGNWRQMK